MAKHISNLIVDLDTLLDTRQGTLSKLLSKEELNDFITSEEYLLRTKDNFSVVDMKRYNRLYEKRDKQVISNSIVTYMFNIVRTKLVDLVNKTLYNTDIKEINLLINIYPYELSKVEIDTIINALFIKMNPNVFIKPMNKSPEQLTPSFLHTASIDYIFLYDINKWFNANTTKLQEHPLSKTTLFLPALIDADITDDAKHKLDKTGFKDVHSLTEYTVSPYITLNYIPILFYSNVITVSAQLELINREKSL